MTLLVDTHIKTQTHIWNFYGLNMGLNISRLATKFVQIMILCCVLVEQVCLGKGTNTHIHLQKSPLLKWEVMFDHQREGLLVAVM